MDTFGIMCHRFQYALVCFLLWRQSIGAWVLQKGEEVYLAQNLEAKIQDQAILSAQALLRLCLAASQNDTEAGDQ